MLVIMLCHTNPKGYAHSAETAFDLCTINSTDTVNTLDFSRVISIIGVPGGAWLHFVCGQTASDNSRAHPQKMLFSLQFCVRGPEWFMRLGGQ